MKRQTLLVIGLASLVAFGAQANQERLALSVKEARMETDKTAEQLKATLTSLNALTKQSKGDLRPAYDAYCANVAKTEKDASVTKSRALWMEGDGRRYFQDWQKTVDQISNESLRKKAQKRLEEATTLRQADPNEYVARSRIERKLGGADRYVEAHFDGANPYQSEIDRNMSFLRDAIETADLKRLRRYCYSLSARARRAA